MAFFFLKKEISSDICLLGSVLLLGREMRTSDGLWEEWTEEQEVDWEAE